MLLSNKKFSERIKELQMTVEVMRQGSLDAFKAAYGWLPHEPTSFFFDEDWNIFTPTIDFDERAIKVIGADGEISQLHMHVGVSDRLGDYIPTRVDWEDTRTIVYLNEGLEVYHFPKGEDPCSYDVTVVGGYFRILFDKEGKFLSLKNKGHLSIWQYYDRMPEPERETFMREYFPILEG